MAHNHGGAIMISFVAFTVLSVFAFIVCTIGYIAARLSLPEWCAIPIIIVTALIWSSTVMWAMGVCLS